MCNPKIQDSVNDTTLLGYGQVFQKGILKSSWQQSIWGKWTNFIKIKRDGISLSTSPLLLLRHTHSPSSATSCLGVLTTDTEAVIRDSSITCIFKQLQNIKITPSIVQKHTPSNDACLCGHGSSLASPNRHGACCPG